jgi:hypothetical protein
LAINEERANTPVASAAITPLAALQLQPRSAALFALNQAVDLLCYGSALFCSALPGLVVGIHLYQAREFSNTDHTIT